MAQTTGIESLESVLDVMTSRISSLKDLISRISTRINDPFQKLESRTIQLARLQVIAKNRKNFNSTPTCASVFRK